MKMAMAHGCTRELAIHKALALVFDQVFQAGSPRRPNHLEVIKWWCPTKGRKYGDLEQVRIDGAFILVGQFMGEGHWTAYRYPDPLYESLILAKMEVKS